MTLTGTAAEILAEFRAPRPARADGARNFDAIINAARANIAEHGSEVTLETIAKSAGVGITTLYRNFPTREALTEHLYADEITAVAADATSVGTLEPWNAFAEWTLRFADHISAEAHLSDTIDPQGALSAASMCVIAGAAAPIIELARVAGVLRTDLTDRDIIRAVFGLATMPVDDQPQRRRILTNFIDSLRHRDLL